VKTSLKIVLPAIVVILIVVAAGFYILNELLEPPAPAAEDEEVIFTVPEGASVADVAAILKEEKLIRSELALRFMIWKEYDDISLIAGDYKLSPSMPPDEIINRIKSGDVFIETRKFVIPEGSTVEQIAARLAREGFVDEEEFLRLAQEPPSDLKEKYSFLKEVPGEVYYALEGYLFPATYEVEGATDAAEVINLMLQRFQVFLSEEKYRRAEEKGFSMHEVVTLASIIKREVASPREWEKVASVFHNRLDTGMLLESCATVQYALEEHKERLLYSDLEVESPYNTYRNPGLPPGPISSPGEASLEAVLYPKETDYFYFVSKQDGSGEHYFAQTLAEHNANIEKARGNQ